MSAAQARRCRGTPIYSMICASSSGAAGSRSPSTPRAIMASSCASDIRSVTGAVASSSLGISDATTRTNSTGCVHAAVISAGLPKACHASQRSRKNSSLSLLREPRGRPLGLPDWPGLNWVNSLPVTCFPPVVSGLRLTISVHRIRFTCRSLHRTVKSRHRAMSASRLLYSR